MAVLEALGLCPRNRWHPIVPSGSVGDHVESIACGPLEGVFVDQLDPVSRKSVRSDPIDGVVGDVGVEVETFERESDRLGARAGVFPVLADAELCRDERDVVEILEERGERRVLTTAVEGPSSISAA